MRSHNLIVCTAIDTQKPVPYYNISVVCLGFYNVVPYCVVVTGYIINIYVEMFHSEKQFDELEIFDGKHA